MNSLVAINSAIEARGRSGTATALHQIRGVFDEWEGWELREFGPVGTSPTRVGRLARSLSWDFRRFAQQAERSNIRTLIFPTNAGWPLRGQKSILVMHDTMVINHARHFDPGYRATARATFPLSVARSDVVVTPSHVSADAIRAMYRPKRLLVIPWYGPQLDGETVDFEARERCILVVAPSNGHKRLHVAVEALAAFNSLARGKLSLRLVGGVGTGETRLRETIERLDPQGVFVRRSSYLTDDQLAAAYRSAFAVLVPSLDEGFGLPLLEAAAHGTPVVHARTGALQEVIPIPGHAIDFGALDLVRQLLLIQEPEEWSRRQEAGIEALGRYSRDGFVESWRGLVEEVTNED